MMFSRIALVAAALLVALPASAEKLDLSTITCKDFVALNKDEMGPLLAWLDAYYKDDNDPPIIDFDKFVANAKKLGEYCGANPTIGLITATDKLFGK